MSCENLEEKLHELDSMMLFKGQNCTSTSNLLDNNKKPSAGGIKEQILAKCMRGSSGAAGYLNNEEERMETMQE